MSHQEAEATVRPTNLVADGLARRIVAGGGDNVVLDSATDRSYRLAHKHHVF